MTIQFNSSVIPHPKNEEPFGFVQTCYSPNSNEKIDSFPDCKKCSCPHFPCKDGSFSCPICSPDSDFKENVILTTGGLERRSLYYFVFDVSMPIEKTRTLMTLFVESLEESDTVIVMTVCGSQITFLYVENMVPFFSVVDDPSKFIPTDLYELTKSELSSIIIPSLPALYSVQKSKNEPVDVLMPLHLAMKLHEKRSFAVFFFLVSPTIPITAPKAAVVGKSMALQKGIVHFGACENFKRLTAIAHNTLGCVFGISEIMPDIICKMMDLSRPVALRLYCPRFIEVAKVTGCDGAMRVTSAITVANLENAVGCSVRLAADTGRIKSRARNVRILEVANSVDGKYLKLHTFGFAEKPEEFCKTMDNVLTQNLVLKGFASDVLRGAWAGENWEKLIEKGRKPKLVSEYSKESIVQRMPSISDRDALRLYYILGCFATELKQKLIKLDSGYVFVMAPVVFIYSTENPCDIIDIHAKSNWVFEVRLFTDLDAFKILIEKYNEKLE